MKCSTHTQTILHGGATGVPTIRGVTIYNTSQHYQKADAILCAPARV